MAISRYSGQVQTRADERTQVMVTIIDMVTGEIAGDSRYIPVPDRPPVPVLSDEPLAECELRITTPESTGTLFPPDLAILDIDDFLDGI